MTNKRASISAILVALAVAVPLSAQPGGTARAQSASGQEMQRLIDRIDRLQREMITLQNRVYRGKAPPPSEMPAPASTSNAAMAPNIAAAMQVRLDEIEVQMRTFTGRLEELNHAVDQANARLDKLVADMDFRLKALETALAKGGSAAPAAQAPGAASAAPATPPPTSPQPGVLGTLSASDLAGPGAPAGPPVAAAPAPGPAPQVATTPALLKGTVREQYDFATTLLARGDMDGAQRAFDEFLARHSKHQLAGNAQYWLGQTYYKRKDYRNAAIIWAEGYRKYPKSRKGPDFLLKLGISLEAMGKADRACATYARFAKEYPNARANLKALNAEHSKKLGCR